MMLFYRLPEVVRMTIVAIIGSAIGWLTYELLYWLNPLTQYRATSAWIVEFTIGILRQHAMHRYFTFTERSPYWRTLRRAYVYYISASILSAGVNALLTERLHLHYRPAWLLCTLLVALMSLIFLKRKVFLLGA